METHASRPLEPTSRALVARYFETRDFASRQRVTPFDPEAPAQAFVVLDGVFRVYVPMPDGSEVVKTLATPGTPGVTPYRAAKSSPPAVVEALTAGTLALAPFASLLRSAEGDPALREELDRRWADYEADKEQRLIEARCLSARERYERAERRLGAWADAVPLYEVANWVGVSAVQLSRIRRQMLAARS